MTTQKNTQTQDTSDREILITRDFDAPRELIWKVWTDPKHVAKWWGPRGFSTTIEKMDFRPGGQWRHVMRGPDGAEYPNHSVFIEIIEPERIVYSHGGHKEGGSSVRFESTWTFEVLEKGRTRVTMRGVFPTTEERDRVVKEFGAIEGGKQTLQRLGEYLAQEPAYLEKNVSPDDRDFQISRVFAAPRELMWKVWTETEHMAKWWGPHDFTCPVCELEVRVGGAYRLVMRAPKGGEYPCRGLFLEVVKPERLVMTMDLSGHPEKWFDLIIPNRDKAMKPELDCVQTVTLEEEGEGRTRLTIRTRFESKSIRQAMVKAGMNEGWSESLDRMAGRVVGLVGK